MEIIDSILEILLPFEFIDYEFMKNAILAIILISPIFAILGTMIVNKKMAFFSDALGHSALTGIALRKFNRNKQFKYRNDNICNLFCTITKLRKKQNNIWSRHNNKCILINSNSTWVSNTSTNRKLQPILKLFSRRYIKHNRYSNTICIFNSNSSSSFLVFYLQ